MVLKCTFLKTKAEARTQTPFKCLKCQVIVCEGCAYVCHSLCQTQQLREGSFSCPCKSRTSLCRLVSDDELTKASANPEVQIFVLANQDHVVAVVSDSNASQACSIT